MLRPLLLLLAVLLLLQLTVQGYRALGQQQQHHPMAFQTGYEVQLSQHWMHDCCWQDCQQQQQRQGQLLQLAHCCCKKCAVSCQQLQNQPALPLLQSKLAAAAAATELMQAAARHLQSFRRRT